MRSIPKLFVALPVLLAGVVAVAFFLYAPPSVATPSVSWSPSSLSQTVTAGQSTTTTATFTANENAQNVTVRVVPEIAPYVTVSPSSFANITKGASYPVTVTFSAPATTSPTTVNGTIQLRQEKGTLAKPLPVTLGVVWPIFDGGEDLGFSIQYPPEWIVTSRVNTVEFSNVSERGELSESTLQTESFLQVRLLPNENPKMLSVGEWFDESMRPLVADLLMAERYLTIDSHDAIQIEQSAIGGRRVYIYVPRYSDIWEITYGLFAPNFIDDYEEIIRSLRWAAQ